ncbi:CPBP family intramembrane metalloprotease [Rhodobacteraceae bacterium 2CG4]|uniref:CPBP family intramembrane metalloprotease n=1 Tax=Halovulum marinum TaxID=2662447 RepID=A0A6L5YYR4_9RHOB|nr:type II CAAX endopeptidase family protein [Halovulum marinum]MSU89427.1 CPBP family intramembrane metalloprotease [Halovulum marinum]
MTTPLDNYRTEVAPLRDRAQIWRLLVGLGFAAGGQVAATLVIFAAFAGIVALGGVPFGQALDQAGALRSPGSLIAVLATFAGVTAGLWLAMRLLHRAPLGAVTGTGGRLDGNGFAVAAALFLALGLVAVLLTLPFQGLQRNLDLGRWVIWVGPALLVTFIQVHAEELVFRGYLQAHLASRFRSPAVFIGVPALIFASAHLPNAAAFGANAWLVLLAPLMIGLMTGHLTVRTGNLGAAVGLHFANNTLGLLLVAVPGPFGQLGLFQHPFDPADVATVRPFILGNLGFLLLAYGAFLVLVPPRRAGLQHSAEVFK